MADINRWLGTGRLTRDLTVNQSCVGSAAIAVNRPVKKGDVWDTAANFFDITIFGNMAKTLEPYMKKGAQVSIEGELRQDRWEKDGEKKSKVHIVVNKIVLGAPKKQEQASAPSYDDYGDYNGDYN